MSLNSEQKRAFNDIRAGKNVFITGPGGVGKSHLVKEVINQIDGFVVTATTGIAAINVGGRTIHSFLMLGVGDKTKEELWKELSSKRFLLRGILKTSKVIIDEISMADDGLFDKIEFILRKARRSKRPFGNVQVIIVGDALQLPFISNGENKFFFESEAYKNGKFVIHELKEIQRQRDKDFIFNLNKIRIGRVDNDVIKYFQARVGVKPQKNLAAVYLHTHNYGVDQINLKKLQEIPLESKTNTWITTGGGSALTHLEKNCPAPKDLVLKVGAQVICLANVDLECGIANGSVGVVIRFESQYPVVRFNNGVEKTMLRHTWEVKERVDGEERILASLKQIPLRLGWAISVHKSQGQTLDHAIVNLSKAFEYGMTYTALSRVKNLDGLYIEAIDWDKAAAHPDALKFYKNIGGLP